MLLFDCHASQSRPAATLGYSIPDIKCTINSLRNSPWPYKKKNLSRCFNFRIIKHYSTVGMNCTNIILNQSMIPGLMYHGTIRLQRQHTTIVTVVPKAILSRGGCARYRTQALAFGSEELRSARSDTNSGNRPKGSWTTRPKMTTAFNGTTEAWSAKPLILSRIERVRRYGIECIVRTSSFVLFCQNDIGL